MPNDYLPIVVLVAISTILAIVIIVLGASFGPKRAKGKTLEPYESGMRTLGASVRRMPVRFYLIAVLFILFDIEVIFFLPWAVAFHELGVYGFAQMMVFIGVLLIADIWAWRRGAFEWE